VTPPLDIHVHLLGNGKNGSGCFSKSPFWMTPFIAAMRNGIGLAVGPDAAELDDAYIEVLNRWVQQSGLGGAVVLACDLVYDSAGQRRPDLTRLYVPNEWVLQVCARHPKMLPGISVHPARPDAIELLERFAAQGAVLNKLLPCVHIVECNNTSYRRFWRKMAELGLPLLAHTGGEFSLPTYRRDLRSPECLRLPLECGVTVIAAHCGAPALPCERSYFDAFDALRRHYPNLYGDIAALSQVTHLETLERLRANPERILLGSDYPVLTSVFWSRWKGWLTPAQYAELKVIRNPLEKKLRLTRALGFPEEVFSGGWKLLRRLESHRYP
jgi:uncharacterized protein